MSTQLGTPGPELEAWSESDLDLAIIRKGNELRQNVTYRPT
eukprot:gene2788-3407_t